MNQNNQRNPLGRPMYTIPVNDKKFSLYLLYANNNLVVLMCPAFAGTQFYVSQIKRTVKIVVPPVKDLDRNMDLIRLWNEICNMYHARMTT